MGASIGYWQGDVQKLTEDIAALKPAIFLGVPRVFDRIYSKVMAQVGVGPWSVAGVSYAFTSPCVLRPARFVALFRICSARGAFAVVLLHPLLQKLC